MIDDLITLDTTGDGIDDSMLYYDENGGCTMLSDYDHDGQYEQMAYFSGTDYWGNPTEVTIMLDTDADGNYDTGITQITDQVGDLVTHAEFNDYDQDGNIDMMKMFQDTTGDGLFDTVAIMHADNSDSEVLNTVEIHHDLTGDQQPDLTTRLELIDNSGNGEPDIVNITLTDASGQEFAYEMPYDEYVATIQDAMGELAEPGYTTTCFPANMVGAAQFDPDTANPDLVSGDPAADMEYWEFQGNTGRCAIYAQKFVLEEALGREIPIEELVAVAEEHGWFNESDGGGTTTLNMDKLLEYYGVEHEMSFDNGIDSLEEALKDGKNVIVGVDSGQIWYGEDNNIFSPDTRADHAVQVIGIDRTDPDAPMVVLNDSGTPEGRGELVPLDVFENAWNAGDSQMIICYA